MIEYDRPRAGDHTAFPLPSLTLTPSGWVSTPSTHVSYDALQLDLNPHPGEWVSLTVIVRRLCGYAGGLRWW